MKEDLPNDWRTILTEEIEKTYYTKLRQFVADEYSTETIYPPINDIMNAFYTTAYHDVKVVILGQVICTNYKL
ncbi:uracil-DNA glycosylase [Lysinibacillus xylanilyticus]|uniref:hypothetical protein n=1 Tax=Lysinibacillus xylanilyticus TaxID=582475 RepID=UPI003829F57F